jgi:hypothetical protein
MPKSKTEVRVVVKYADGRTNTHPKKSFEKAEADVLQLIEERRSGRLSPYWDGAKFVIQSREVAPWKTVTSQE